MKLQIITSVHNPLLKEAVLLRSRPTQDRFFVEGTRFTEELPAECILRVYTTNPEKHRAFLDRLPDTPVYRLSDDAMKKICVAVSGQTLACEVRKAPTVRPDKLILLDRVQDPGNVGTVIRSAYAFGFGVILSPGCANPYSPKALMATAGAFRCCHIEQSENLPETVSALRKDGYSVYASALDRSAIRPEDLRPAKKRAVIIGNEGQGISDEVRASAEQTVFLPMETAMESLNAAVAASILAYLLK